MKARTFLEALRNTDPDSRLYLVNEARCLRFLGSVLHTLRRDGEAIRSLSEAVHLLEETSEEARRQDSYRISNLAVIYGDLGELQHKTGRLADSQVTLEKADALGLRYTGQAGSPRLDSIWLVDSRISLGMVRMQMGKRDQAREAFLNAGETVRGLPQLAAQAPGQTNRAPVSAAG
jgi:tetratricopeptide (TPR) repeat protein